MQFNPYAEVILAAIIWGSTGVFVKMLDLPATTISFFRVGIPVIVLLIYFKSRKIKLFDVENRALMFFASFLFGIKTVLMMIGFQLAPISTAVIVIYTWPIFAAIFSVIILKETIVKRNIYLMFLAFAGIVIVFFNQTLSFDNMEFLGLFFMLLVAILHALVIVIFKRESVNNSKYKTIFYQNFAGLLMFLPSLFLNQPYPTPVQMGVGIAYGALIGLVSFSLFFSALKRMSASTATQITYVEVVSATLFGILIFGESLTPNIVVGGLMIIISTYLLKR